MTKEATLRLSLFDLIDNTVKALELNYPTYKYVEQKLTLLFEQALIKHEERFVGINTRIKSADSLKEKIIRNKFYMNCESAEEVLASLHDLIGINIECRFITDEQVMLELLKQLFEKSESDFSMCLLDASIYMNFKVPQPQLQRNGFTIYRLDGYVKHNDKTINFELQIKSLIHNFWSDVEHQVVYKNNHLVYFDHFMQNILASIRDNLDVVDNQLQIVYKQIKDESIQTSDIGMSEEGFKMFLAKAINDLYTVKMKESVGITSNFKKCSGILSQYFYVKDFLHSNSTQFKMVEYFEQFNLLKISELDFTYPITLETEFQHYCPFIQTIGTYWVNAINDDFEWHSFFVMLFAIEAGNNIQDFTSFIKVIRDLIVMPSWFNSKFGNLSADQAKDIKDSMLLSVASEMVNYGKIDMIFESKLIAIMECFHKSVEEIDTAFKDYDKWQCYKENVLETFKRKIKTVLKERQ